MRTIVLDDGGSPPDDATPDEEFFEKAMDNTCELWWLTLTTPGCYQLAYVQPFVRRVNGRMQAAYRLHFATCVDELSQRDWEALKERGERTTALDVAGAEAVQLMQLAQQGRLNYTEAVGKIAQRAQTRPE